MNSIARKRSRGRRCRVSTKDLRKAAANFTVGSTITLSLSFQHGCVRRQKRPTLSASEEARAFPSYVEIRMLGTDEKAGHAALAMEYVHSLMSHCYRLSFLGHFRSTTDSLTEDRSEASHLVPRFAHSRSAIRNPSLFPRKFTPPRLD